MTGAIMQPTFNPWLGYFDLIDRCDVFVFYDDVQLARRSWQTRNRIKTAQGETMLSVPVKKTRSRNDLLICHAEINNAEKWQKKHLGSMAHAYKKAPCYQEVFPLVEAHYSRNHEGLASFNIDWIEAVCERIGIHARFIRSSSLSDIRGDKDVRLYAICKALEIDQYLSPQGAAGYIEQERPGGELGAHGVQVWYHDYQPVPYAQLHGAFMPYMGILDLLFNVGFSGAAEVIRAGQKPNISSEQYRKEHLNTNA